MSANGAPLWRCNVGLVNVAYLLWLFVLLAPYCTHVPGLVQRRDGSFYCHLTTRAMTCLLPIYDLFIENGKKRITLALAEWLTPLSLAICFILRKGTLVSPYRRRINELWMMEQPHQKDSIFVLSHLVYKNITCYNRFYESTLNYTLQFINMGNTIDYIFRREAWVNSDLLCYLIFHLYSCIN